MKGGRQMETNDSGIPRVVRGAANRLETDYISLALSLRLCLCLSPTLAPILCLSRTHLM